MIRSEPVAGSSEAAPIVVHESHREKVVVRRRRAHSRHRTGNWTVRNSRRKIVRVAVVCAGVLFLMAVGLYLGLARQDVAPRESGLHGPALAARGAHG